MEPGGQIDDIEAFARQNAIPLALGVAALLLFSLGAGLGVDVLVGLGFVLVVAAVVVVLRARQPESPTMLTVPVSDAVRQQRLQEALAADLARTAGRIESQTPYSAVLISGQRVNHILHLLISVLLCGLWLPVWLILGLSSGERRTVITVDACGNVLRRR